MLLRKNRAFTLIELLVVVLIIGILSAIALPQYQKAVEKARFVDMISIVTSIIKSMDMYIMENGSSSDTVYFTGTNSVASIEIAGTADGNATVTPKFGSFTASCSYGFCTINQSFPSGYWYLYAYKNYNNSEWSFHEGSAKADHIKLVKDWLANTPYSYN